MSKPKSMAQLAIEYLCSRFEMPKIPEFLLVIPFVKRAMKRLGRRLKDESTQDKREGSKPPD